MTISYVQAIALGFSGCQVETTGDPTVYANLVRHSGIALPTQAVLDAYILANSAALLVEQALATGINALDNGMPAYIEPVGGVLTSVAIASYSYLVKTTGTRNAYLSILGSIASNTLGFKLPRNALLRGVTVMSSSNVSTATDAFFELHVNKSNTPLTSYLLSRGTSYGSYIDLSVPLNIGDELSIYLNSANNVINPICLLEVSWRN
jgi:hypothetical protein